MYSFKNEPIKTKVDAFKAKAQQIKTKVVAKKLVILAVTGAFVLTGFGATQIPQSVALAATRDFHQQDRYYDQDFSPERMAENMQEIFGIEKQVILDYNAKGWRFRDLHEAAFISYASQKSFSDVLNAKTVINSWRDVSENFGLTRQQRRSAESMMMSNQMATYWDISASTIKELLDAGYHPRDIGMAATLSKKADKSIDTVLEMKKINNAWYDVAASLGLSDADYNQCRDDARFGYGDKKGIDRDYYRGGHRGNAWHY